MNSPSLKKMHYFSLAWGAMLISIFILLTCFGFFYKSRTKEYKELEKLMTTKTLEYVDQKGITINGYLKVTKEELIDNEILATFKVKDNDCEGYVIVTENGDKNNYDAYIQCGKYKTKGYQK